MQNFHKLSVLLLLLIALGCSSGDDSNDSNDSNDSGDSIDSIEGLTYTAVEISIDTPVDLNGDGVFSLNILDEVDCYIAALSFNQEKVYPPNWYGLRIWVDNMESDPAQNFGCGSISGNLPIWLEHEDYVEILSSDTMRQDSNASEISPYPYRGYFSNNKNTITFNFDHSMLGTFREDSSFIITESGDIVRYEGNVKMVYEKL
ncbi:hypothetical protein [Psychroflexus aestuariivivens]|uniref:hypothetical protein n=1 Tax=Psychroflexus aestuariivivens TaxID=1795040 RepID=UPI000FD7E046|nr:hypothetical protein [Psychroflexus aestuariivivens]